MYENLNIALDFSQNVNRFEIDISIVLEKNSRKIQNQTICRQFKCNTNGKYVNSFKNHQTFIY